MAAAKRNRTSHNPVHTVISGSPLRMESPNSNRQPKHGPAYIVMQEVNPVGGFLAFLRDYAVVGLAVGFVIGLQAQSLVKQLVASFIDPAFKLLFGQALSQRTLILEFHGRTASFTWGAFIYGLLNFLFVIGAIYAIVKIFKLDKLDKPKKGGKKVMEEVD